MADHFSGTLKLWLAHIYSRMTVLSCHNYSLYMGWNSIFQTLFDYDPKYSFSHFGDQEIDIQINSGFLLICN